MTVQSWRSLCSNKNQLTLRLFLLLNVISALFTVLNPISKQQHFTLPAALIALGSAGLLIWHCRHVGKKFHAATISLISGCLWAWHVAIKLPLAWPTNPNYVVIALLSVLFIGTIAFASDVLAFILHSLPVFIVCLVFNDGHEWLRMCYCLALPVAGITIQHIIQKRNDAFTQSLMHKLLEERETLNDLSMLDPLTGLYNRRGFQSRFDALSALGPVDHYVLLLDIDHFKAYNDHYGHMMGDKALIQVSAAVRNAVRSRDIVTRFGGEEFMVLLPGVDADRAMEVAERIRQQVYDLRIPHMFNASVATHVTISIGLAPLVNNRVDEALELADKALYQAKHLGRNNILTSQQVCPA